MTNPEASAVLSANDSDLLHLRRSFIRHLAADRRTPATRSAYTAAIVQLEAFLLERGLLTAVTELTPDHLEAFIVSLYERGVRPTTILARHHALSRFFGWLVAENELATSPMASIRAPAATLPEPQVLTSEEIAALLAACEGDAFEDLRDVAMILLFLDTGLRRTELASYSSTTLTLICRPPSWLAIEGLPAPHPSTPPPPGASNATWRHAPSTRGCISHIFGSGGAADSPTVASTSPSGTAVGEPDWRTSIRSACAIPSCASISPTAVAAATSCAWSAGRAVSCWPATASMHARNGLGPSGSASETGCSSSCHSRLGPRKGSVAS
jgi:hypothetical protein